MSVSRILTLLDGARLHLPYISQYQKTKNRPCYVGPKKMYKNENTGDLL